MALIPRRRSTRAEPSEARRMALIPRRRSTRAEPSEAPLISARSLVVAVLAAALAATPSTAAAAGQKAKKGGTPTRDSVREELDAVRKDLEKKAAREKERDKKVSRLLEDMRALDGRLLASARKREELKLEEKKLEEERKLTVQRLASIEREYEDARARIQRRLSGVYKRGRLGSTRVLAHAATSTEPLRIARYLAAISRTDGSELSRFETIQFQHEGALRELDSKKRAIAGKQAALQDEAERYDVTRKEKAMMLAGLQEELAAEQTTVEKLKATEGELQKLLASIPPPPPEIPADERVGPEPEPETATASLAPPAPAEPAAPPPAGPLERLFRAERPSAPFQDRKGDLEVPVRGPIVSRYGDRTEAALRVQGLLVRGERDQHVLAVARGEVVFSGPFPGLGNTLIINHGSRYHTVYANLDEVRREVGARVRENEVIGTLGPSQPTLHFELRAEGKALDPLVWFRGGQAAFAQ
jgi:septal ring factor EnvC (AmiA/AmiB activator)